VIKELGTQILQLHDRSEPTTIYKVAGCVHGVGQAAASSDIWLKMDGRRILKA
jgi:hypothetical protein